MSEQLQKETHPKESSSFSELVEGAREVVHSAIEHAITHGVAHVIEHGGGWAAALAKYLRAPYPGTPLLRPHSVWLWRSVPLLKTLEPLKRFETVGKVLGSKTFAIATEVIKEDSAREINYKEEKRMIAESAREARIAEMKIPKVEQGIAYKNGSVYFPVSKQWIFPPIVIKPLHLKHSHHTHPSHHSGLIPHPRASLHVELEMAGSLKSLPTTLCLSVHQPAHFRRNQILIKATPMFFENGPSNHDQRLDRLGNLVDQFLYACVYPPQLQVKAR